MGPHARRDARKRDINNFNMTLTMNTVPQHKITSTYVVQAYR